MKKQLFALVLSLGCCALQGARASPAIAEEDIQKLQRSSHFTRGLVGFAGHRSASDLLFEKLLHASNAQAVFVRVAQSPYSTGAAKAYAACGLKKLGSQHLAAIVKQLQREADVDVSSMHGDVLVKKPLPDVARDILATGC